jgi:tetratricopeptide (TPR) repeat protein
MGILVLGVVTIVIIGRSHQRSPEDAAKLLAATQSIWASTGKGAAGAGNHDAVPRTLATPQSAATDAGSSAARQLVDRAKTIYEGSSLTRAQLDAAGELCDRALQLDDTDPIVWARAAKADLMLIHPYGYDLSEQRRQRAVQRAARASSLAPDLFEVRVVQAAVYAHAVGTPALLAEAEKTLRELSAEEPDDHQLILELGEVLREENRFDDAAKVYESIGEFEIAAWSYFQEGKLREALTAVGKSRRTASALQLKAMLQLDADEDPDEAQATIDQLKPRTARGNPRSDRAPRGHGTSRRATHDRTRAGAAPGLSRLKRLSRTTRILHWDGARTGRRIRPGGG